MTYSRGGHSLKLTWVGLSSPTAHYHLFKNSIKLSLLEERLLSPTAIDSFAQTILSSDSHPGGLEPLGDWEVIARVSE